MKKRQILWWKHEFHGLARFHGKVTNSAARLEIPQSAKKLWVLLVYDECMQKLVKQIK